MTLARRTRILIACGALLVLLLAVAFRGPLFRPLVVLALHRSFGLDASVAQVGGSFLTGLDLRSVTARGEAAGGPLASFEADRISARYALWALLHGKEAFLDSLDVTMERATLDLDLTGPPAADLQTAKHPASPSPLPRLPHLTVSDSRVRVRGRDYTLEADGLRGTVAHPDQAGEQAVEISADRFSLRHSALRQGTLSVTIAGRYSPRRLEITAAQVDGEPIVKHARLDLGERPGDLDLLLDLSLWRGSIEFGMLRRSAGTEVRWDARGIDLQPQVILVDPALGALRGVLSTNGEVRFGGGGMKTLTGNFSLDWKGALLAGRAVDHLTIRGSAEPGVILVELAEGRVASNELLLRRVILPASPLFEGRWRALLAEASGEFFASLGDVPGFLAIWGVRTGNATVPDHHLRLEGTLERGEVQLVQGDLSTGLGKTTLDALTLIFPRENQGWGETAFSGGATFTIPDLKDVSALFPMPPLGGALRGEITATGTFARPEGRASLTGRGITVAGTALGDIDLQARATAGRISIDSLQVRQGESRFTAQDVRFTTATLAANDLGGFLDGIEGSFTLGSTDLPALAAVAGIPREAVARIPATHRLTAAGSVQGRAITFIAGSFAAAGGSITLGAGRIVLPPPGADWSRDTMVEGDLVVDIPDLEPVATIFQLPPLQGTLEGRTQISGSLAAPSASVAVSGRGIVIDGHPVGAIAVKATVQAQRLTVDSLEVTRGTDRLHTRGSYDLATGTLLDVEADVSLADVAPYLKEFVRETTPVSGRLHVMLRSTGPLPGTPLVIKAEFSEGRIRDFQGVQGVVGGTVRFPGTLRQPHISMTARVAGVSGGLGGHPIRGSFEAAYEPGQLRIGAFELAGSGGLAVTGKGTVPLDLAADDLLSPGPISIETQANIPALEELAFLLPPAYALTGALRADIVLAGSWKEPSARVELSGERLLLPPGIRFVPPGPVTLAGTLTWGRAEARAEKMRLTSPLLSFSLSGAWSSPPSLSSLFSGTGGARTGSLSLRASFSAPDIGWLRESVAGLRRLNGSVAGEIAIEGPADDPVLSGEIRIADAALRYGDLPPIDTLNATATVARRKVTLKEFNGSIGGSPFTLAGSMDFSRMDDPILDLRLLGKNVLLYRDEGLRIRADSDLTLRGPFSALSLTGEMALTNSLYQKNISVANLLSSGDKAGRRPTPGIAGISFPEPPLRDMRFNIHLTALEPFQIRTDVVRGAARPDLRLTGTGLLPILSGALLVDTARVMLPSGTLEIERGTVLIHEGDPDRPSLDFGGRMQSRGYEITAQIGGTLDSPEVILSSTPPLPSEELLLFVLTGVPPGSGGAEGGTVTSMASPMAIYLGKNVVGRLFGGRSRTGKPGFQDRIELQIGREMTRTGSVTLDARLLLLNRPMGRHSTLYVTSEKDIYDQFNAGLKIIFTFK
jgi:hypothetical protein